MNVILVEPGKPAVFFLIVFLFALSCLSFVTQSMLNCFCLGFSWVCGRLCSFLLLLMRDGKEGEQVTGELSNKQAHKHSSTISTSSTAHSTTAKELHRARTYRLLSNETMSADQQELYPIAVLIDELKYAASCWSCYT